MLIRSDVRKLLSIAACIDVVESAFRLHGEAAVPSPGVLATHLANGGFHIKAGVMPFEGRWYYAAKTNGNFPRNPTEHSLPTIQGVVVLFDAACGRPLALMDSMEITALRTAAATAVAARYLARRDSRTLTVIGCGQQARSQVAALSVVLPIDRVFAYDLDPDRAVSFARDTSLGLEIEAIANFVEGTRRSDVIVTCTSSRLPFLTADHVRPGTFVAAVGADSEDKQELDPTLVAANRVVPDVVSQAAAFGELHHAVAAGLIGAADVADELGQVVAGKRPGRTSSEEITIFDSTGMALQDVAAACLVYTAAQADTTMQRVRLSQ